MARKLFKRRAVTRTRYVRSARVHHKRKFNLPLLPIAGMIPGAALLYQHRGEGIEGIVQGASRIYLGYCGTNKFGYNDTIGFHPQYLRYGTVPILVGFAAHMVANKLGVNRVMRRMTGGFLSL